MAHLLFMTRDLKKYIADKFNKPIRSQRDIHELKEDIYFGADVVIATPKRLNELLNIEGFNSAALQTLVLDASHQLLKVGNIAFTQRISDSIPLKQRVALSTENKGSTEAYMDRFAFPFSTEEY